jgi:hypothetical protein
LRKISEYFDHADECRQMAKQAANPDHAATLENMAQTWETLAKEREQLLATRDRIENLDTGALKPASP